MKFNFQGACSRTYGDWSFLQKMLVGSSKWDGNLLPSTSVFNLNFVFKQNPLVNFGPRLSLAFINYPKSMHVSVISIYHIADNLNSIPAVVKLEMSVLNKCINFISLAYQHSLWSSNYSYCFLDLKVH